MSANPESVEQLVWEVRRTFRELTVAADRELKPLGLQAADRAFLEFLAREAEPVSLSVLSRKYGVSRQHMQQTLRRLANPGWIEEKPDASDQRVILLRLSKKGRAAWEKVRAVDEALLERWAKGLTEKQTTEAAATLRTLRGVVS
ncbi:MAG: winged helix DNA-binding protein [Bryobacteraceae bacterium]|nr:winged helix DNA-binding protein [Bryobacteraceae bacterium]